MSCRAASVMVAVALVLLAVAAPAMASQEQGPYEDIQSLLHSAAASSSSLAALDHRGPPRVVEVHHDHHHLVPHDMPAHVAEHLAEVNTPLPPPVAIVSVQNPVKVARHAAEDAAYAAADRIPSVHTVDVRESTVIHGPPAPAPAPLAWTIKGQRGDTKDDADWKVKGSGFHFPLVDRGLKKPHFMVIADTDGVHHAGGGKWKPHTALELQAEAARLLDRAKRLQNKRNKVLRGEKPGDSENLGVFDTLDAGYEDEITRLSRVSARMNRLREQIEIPRPTDSFEGSIARHRYYLKIYRSLKRDATEIIESYAMRTGNSIFTLFGDGKVDPSIAAFLPPNSVAAILAQYANPTRGRTDETPRDILSGRDAKRIQYSIDYLHAKRAQQNGTLTAEGHPFKLPLPPVYAKSAEEEEQDRMFRNPRLNKVVARQQGQFGQGRPAVTMGNAGVGRGAVHVSVVNPTQTQHDRGLPYQLNLKTRRRRPAMTAAP